MADENLSRRDLHAKLISEMMTGIQEEAVAGNGPSIDRMLKLMEREAKLLGLDLDDAPPPAPVMTGEQKMRKALDYLKELERGASVDDASEAEGDEDDRTVDGSE